VADVLKGDSWETVAKRHGVSKPTVQKWVQSVKENFTETKPAESFEIARQESAAERFYSGLEQLLCATVTMLNAWAEVCSEKDWVKGNAEDADRLGTTVIGEATRLASFVQRPGNPPN
jgi:transposase